MMTYIREKYGLIGEMSIATFVTILIVVFAAIGGSYAFTYEATSKLSDKMSSSEIQLKDIQIASASQLASIQTSIDLLLKERGIERQKIKQ